jgi:anti-sigma factor RsiW
MTCQELSELLMDYLDGRVPEPVRLRFEEHLEECPDCVAYLATYEQTIRLSKEAWTAGTLPEIPEELVRAVLAARSK